MRTKHDRFAERRTQLRAAALLGGSTLRLFLVLFVALGVRLGFRLRWDCRHGLRLGLRPRLRNRTRLLLRNGTLLGRTWRGRLSLRCRSLLGRGRTWFWRTRYWRLRLRNRTRLLLRNGTLLGRTRRWRLRLRSGRLTASLGPGRRRCRGPSLRRSGRDNDRWGCAGRCTAWPQRVPLHRGRWRCRRRLARIHNSDVLRRRSD